VVKQSTAEILQASLESQRQVAALRHLVEGTEVRLEKKFREIQQHWERHTSTIQQAAETAAEKADRLRSVSNECRHFVGRHWLYLCLLRWRWRQFFSGCTDNHQLKFAHWRFCKTGRNLELV
jgi:hypothetical protein